MSRLATGLTSHLETLFTANLLASTKKIKIKAGKKS